MVSLVFGRADDHRVRMLLGGQLGKLVRGIAGSLGYLGAHGRQIDAIREFGTQPGEQSRRVRERPTGVRTGKPHVKSYIHRRDVCDEQRLAGVTGHIGGVGEGASTGLAAVETDDDRTWFRRLGCLASIHNRPLELVVYRKY